MAKAQRIATAAAIVSGALLTVGVTLWAMAGTSRIVGIALTALAFILLIPSILVALRRGEHPVPSTQPSVTMKDIKATNANLKIRSTADQAFDRGDFGKLDLDLDHRPSDKRTGP